MASMSQQSMTSQPPDPHLLVRAALEADSTRAAARAEIARVLHICTGTSLKVCEGWAELSVQAVELHGVTWGQGARR
jgi:hypothetical protein